MPTAPDTAMLIWTRGRLGDAGLTLVIVTLLAVAAGCVVAARLRNGARRRRGPRA
jgi:hypothetical protein